MKGILYGIGVGPGDPELITVKAVNILKNIDVVIGPRTQKKGSSLALDIASPYLKPDAEILELVFPMVYEEETLNTAWESSSNEILNQLNLGKKVAFLTLGDPMLYSTYIYIYRLLSKKAAQIETIPGITSFCAAASRLGFPLADTNDIISIVPATCERKDLDRALAISDTVVLMKVSKDFPGIIKSLQTNNLADNAVMISKCGHPEESIHYNLTSQELLSQTISPPF
ncbi:hypothetical protein N752_03130 [Desulforamulus aquiferis]|nr:precorrin-2 C(20)-methyltransferase [Desulforamulus aquiferis]RYD06681.1 hypothetical protein N752_03130 [Desulforamulus aquiferis]